MRYVFMGLGLAVRGVTAAGIVKTGEQEGIAERDLYRPVHVVKADLGKGRRRNSARCEACHSQDFLDGSV